MRALLFTLLLAACGNPKPTPIEALGGIESVTGEIQSDRAAVPEFQVVNYDGTPRSRADLVGHPTVVWFFPAAGTPG